MHIIIPSRNSATVSRFFTKPVFPELLLIRLGFTGYVVILWSQPGSASLRRN